MNRVNRLNFWLLLMLLPAQAFTAEDVPCESFQNTQVDQSLITQMLDAAKDGYLYRIKPDSSRMGFCVDSTMGLVSAEFRKFKGGMALGTSNAKALVSIEADSLESDGFFIENMLKSDSFFDVKNFEDITFASTDFEWIGKTNAVLKGNLSLRGVTQAVAFYVEILEVKGALAGKETIIVKATTTVQRSAFGLHTLSPLVSDKVNLCMSVEAERRSPDQAVLDQDWM